jgi:uncharacterized protein YkwD/DNA-directed RNA polymerase subunit RPC12/RpoP
VIRFACPTCKSTLLGRDEQAGKIVACPKCGQHMQAPRPAVRVQRTKGVSARKTLAPPKKASRRPFVLDSVLIAALLAATGAGVWIATRPFHAEPEPSIAANQTPFLPASPPRSPVTTKPETHKPQPAESKPVETKPSGKPPVENKSVETKPPAVKPSPDAKAPSPPPVEEKKEIELADDQPPELPFDLVDAINVHRAKAGLEPIYLDAKVSSDCQSQAERLARNGDRHDDKDLSSKDRMERVAVEEPLTAIEKWMREPARRAAILEPRLRTFGAGFARNVAGQWFSVFDWTRGGDREPPLETTPIQGAIVYPVPAQPRVPLWFPGNETPDPLPDAADKLAGFPITLTFPPSTRIETVTAHLSNPDQRDIDLWLSSPEKPANPRFAHAQQHTICLIAKKPLRPNTRYRVEVSATVNGEPWSAKWGFTTVSAGEIHHEMAGKLLRTLNGLRRRAGLPPVSLDAERSKACAAHARYLGLNTPTHPMLNWNAEQTELPGSSEEGAAVARSAAIQGGGGPAEAVAGLIDSIISRPQVLDPRLHQLGLGYTPFLLGGWIWVLDLGRDRGREADREFFYPAPDQQGVPLIYPPNEVPSPIPADHKGKTAGYAITALFGRRASVTAATAKLVDDKGMAVDGWLSTPEKPALTGFPQRSLCLLPKTPLRPDTRYTVTFNAEVNGRPWRRTWSFATLKEPDRYADDLDEMIVARVNAVRKTAGLKPVRLDAVLSRACQSHARYLALHFQRSAGRGMNVHQQDADLPGASPEGAKAAEKSVIAIVLDPQTCVENWMATLYHRLPILTPDLERVGFGIARVNGHKWACVLDTGNGRTAAPANRPRSGERP